MIIFTATGDHNFMLRTAVMTTIKYLLFNFIIIYILYNNFTFLFR